MKFKNDMIYADAEKRLEYQNKLEESLNELRDDKEWKNIRECITETAKNIIGYRKGDKNKRPDNPKVAELSREQKELRLKIAECKDPEKVTYLKTRRNKLLHDIKTTLLEEKEKDLDEKVSEVDKLKDSAKMFRSVRELNRKKFENTFVLDKDGKKVTNPQDVYETIKEYFQTQFFDETEEKLEPFIGAPRRLNRRITVKEVKDAVMRLKNCRAPGFDMVTGEMIKYGPDKLFELIASVLNSSLEEHKDIEAGKGLLAPLNKPNKIKGPVS